MNFLIGLGYSREWRLEVLQNTMTCYKRILKLEKEGKTNRNREGAETFVKRRFSRLAGPTEWFKIAKGRELESWQQRNRYKGE